MNSSNCRYSGYSRVRSGALAAVLVAATLHSPAAPSQPGGATATGGAASEVTALWQDYDVRFHYFGFTTSYTCSGLEDRLEEILRELGAHPDVRVTASGCFGPNDVSKTLTARIRARMPTIPGEAAADSFTATRRRSV
jgi:ABC-type glycerol-3-phosphate transport system substrate-binding protein